LSWLVIALILSDSRRRDAPLPLPPGSGIVASVQVCKICLVVSLFSLLLG